MDMARREEDSIQTDGCDDTYRRYYPMQTQCQEQEQSVGTTMSAVTSATAAGCDDDRKPNNNSIDSFHERDVLFGRGQLSFNHEGNKLFQLSVRESMRSFALAKTGTDQSNAIQVVIDSVRQSGGRFLVHNTATGVWRELDDDAVKDRVIRAVRACFSRPGKSCRKVLERTQQAPTTNTSANDLNAYAAVPFPQQQQQQQQQRHHSWTSAPTPQQQLPSHNDLPSTSIPCSASFPPLSVSTSIPRISSCPPLPARTLLQSNDAALSSSSSTTTTSCVPNTATSSSPPLSVRSLDEAVSPLHPRQPALSLAPAEASFLEKILVPGTATTAPPAGGQQQALPVRGKNQRQRQQEEDQFLETINSVLGPLAPDAKDPIREFLEA